MVLSLDQTACLPACLPACLFEITSLLEADTSHLLSRINKRNVVISVLQFLLLSPLDSNLNHNHSQTKRPLSDLSGDEEGTEVLSTTGFEYTVSEPQLVATGCRALSGWPNPQRRMTMEVAMYSFDLSLRK
jgi:hypothetical protein